MKKEIGFVAVVVVTLCMLSSCGGNAKKTVQKTGKANTNTEVSKSDKDADEAAMEKKLRL